MKHEPYPAICGALDFDEVIATPERPYLVPRRI
jgi:hypothetical protein